MADLAEPFTVTRDKCIKLGGPVAGPRGCGTNRYASNGTQRIAYELQGVMRRRRPWLILVHGMGFDRSGWDPVLPALRRRFRLVLLDNRGTGRSGQPDGSFAVADMAGDVVAVLDTRTTTAGSLTRDGSRSATRGSAAAVLLDPRDRRIAGVLWCAGHRSRQPNACTALAAAVRNEVEPAGQQLRTASSPILRLSLGA